MFGTAQHLHRRRLALGLIHNYTSMILDENSVDAIETIEALQFGDKILHNDLEVFAEMLHGLDGATVARQNSISVSEGLIEYLNSHRSQRLAALLTRFPRLHWAVLGIASACLIVAFLLESNQEVLQFLDSVQLRTLFAMVVGIGSFPGALLADLWDPFRGSFCVTGATTQLEQLKKQLVLDMREAEIERDTSRLPLPAKYQPSDQFGESSSSPLGGVRYGPRNTVYFHVLTGPLAANVRALNDVLAWASENALVRLAKFGVLSLISGSAIGRKLAGLAQSARESIEYVVPDLVPWARGGWG
eukprot:CAMPEP_0172624816 /NCGR_PEP_ID=MMETSP1068-20121228/139463_1 /TAXON_ID=35684 /ORGANISM="Pseudopedinella elastica, Strain CCMP716" /LENGTH=301 /DNA_ID=CAMNT_0013433905 /DNA_START=135 /DNA_END=1037 /DNA_ORIENTATION=-